jgi:Putative prokaryotic signal transducing protein
MGETERRHSGDQGAPAAGLVQVAVVASRVEADLIAGLLRNNGLRAVVSADDAGGLEPQLQVYGVRVLVAAADEAAARQVLAAAGESPL